MDRWWSEGGEAVTLKCRNLYVHTEVEAVKRVSEREREEHIKRLISELKTKELHKGFPQPKEQGQEPNNEKCIRRCQPMICI